MAAENPSTQAPLTPRAVEAACPGDELRDSAAPGLALRVTPKGARVFRWYLTSARRVITIGRWTARPRPGHVTLAEARTWLERLKEAHRTGRLEVVLAELKKACPRRGGAVVPGHENEVEALTVRRVAADFLANIERRRKRPDEVRRTINNELLPAIGDRPIGAVKPREVGAVVSAVVARGAATQAGKVLAHAKQLFKFAQGRGLADGNPAAPLDAGDLGVENRICYRFLSAEEIAAFWKALDDSKGMTPTVRSALRLVLLTGVRAGELLRATWDEVDLKASTWTIPVAHQKLTRRQERDARPWVVPLAPPALRLLEQLKAFAESLGSRYVTASFASAGGPLTEKALNHAMRRLFAGANPVLVFEGERPTPHDLRRTMRTHLGETLDVEPHIAERCLNHSLGRIVATYDRGDYLVQRRAALEKWGTYVEQLVSGKPAKVVALKGAAGRD